MIADGERGNHTPRCVRQVPLRLLGVLSNTNHCTCRARQQVSWAISWRDVSDSCAFCRSVCYQTRLEPPDVHAERGSRYAGQSRLQMCPICAAQFAGTHCSCRPRRKLSWAINLGMCPISTCPCSGFDISLLSFMAITNSNDLRIAYVLPLPQPLRACWHPWETSNLQTVASKLDSEIYVFVTVGNSNLCRLTEVRMYYLRCCWYEPLQIVVRRPRRYHQRPASLMELAGCTGMPMCYCSETACSARCRGKPQRLYACRRNAVGSTEIQPQPMRQHRFRGPANWVSAQLSADSAAVLGG